MIGAAARTLGALPRPRLRARVPVPRRLLARTIRLAVPIAASYLALVAGLLVEYAIVGRHLGAHGVAALGLAGTLALVLVLTFHGFEVAVQALVARRFGEGRAAEVGQIVDTALLLTALVGIPFSVLLGAGASWIFSSAAQPDIEALAQEYFLWRLPSLPLMMASLSLIGFFNGIGQPRYPAFVFAGILAGNGILCALLVPAMGIAGAGLAASLAAAGGLVAFLVLLARPTLRARYGTLRFAGASLPLARQLTGLAVPVLAQQFLTNFGMYLFVLINARVPDGGVSLAASTLARQIGYITYLPALGFGLAAATLVGQHLGRRQPRRAALAAYCCWGLGFAFMGTIGLVYITFGERLVALFIGQAEAAARSGPAVRELAPTLLVLMGMYQVFEALNTILGKALQGAGETLLVMLGSTVCQWLLFLPAAWFFALRLEGGAYGAVCAMALQLVAAGTWMLAAFLHGRWQRRAL